jgi:hypothetical protein
MTIVPESAENPMKLFTKPLNDFSYFQGMMGQKPLFHPTVYSSGRKSVRGKAARQRIRK